MNISKKKLGYDEIKSLASQYFNDDELINKLSNEEKKKLAYTVTMGKDTSRCMICIPAERPELGRILLVLDVDRSTGDIAMVNL